MAYTGKTAIYENPLPWTENYKIVLQGVSLRIQQQTMLGTDKILEFSDNELVFNSFSIDSSTFS